MYKYYYCNQIDDNFFNNKIAFDKLSHLIGIKGDTNVKIKVKNGNKDLVFELADKRKINKDILKILKKEPYLKRISY